MKNKISYKIIFIMITFMAFTLNVSAEELDFCVQTSALWQMLGYALLVLKILIPIIIIIYGSIDFFKAVVNAKDDSISKAAGILLRRVLLGIFIFFIPTIVYVIFNELSVSSETMKAGAACNICLNMPNDSRCADYKNTAKAQRSY